MNRRNFLRNVTLAIAMNLVPKILQPIDSEILADDLPFETTQIDWSNETYGFRSFTVDSYYFDINKYRK